MFAKDAQIFYSQLRESNDVCFHGSIRYCGTTQNVLADNKIKTVKLSTPATFQPLTVKKHPKYLSIVKCKYLSVAWLYT